MNAPHPYTSQVGDYDSLARRSNEDGVDLVDLPITPADVARIQALVDEKVVNDKLARQVFEGVLAEIGRAHV